MNQRKENGKEKQNRQYNKKNIIIIGFYIFIYKYNIHRRYSTYFTST